jgi:hypothetical protein
MTDDGAKRRGGRVERHVLPRAICPYSGFRETKLPFQIPPRFVVHTSPGDVHERHGRAEDNWQESEDDDGAHGASEGRREDTLPCDP